MRTLSKSVPIMFAFDLIILGLSTAFWYGFFQLPQNLKLVTIIITVIAGLFSLFLKANYKIREFNNTKKNAYLLFEGVIFSQIPAFILFLIFFKHLVVIKFLLVNLVTIFLGLKLYRAIFHYYLFNLKPVKNVLIIGNNSYSKLIADEIINKQALMMNVVGFVEDYSQEDVVEDKTYKIYKQPVDLTKLIKEKKIDIVVIANKQRLNDELLSDLVSAIPRHVKLYRMADMYEMITGKLFINKQSINRLFYDFMNKRSIAYDICKRIFDVVAAVIILIVTFPILFYVGIRVKMTDGGKAIYTQNRVGKGGKVFKCYKLRTMYSNDYVPKNVQQGGYAENQDSDDRVIPFCKFVRKARFDEIPQMINILKGEMSIVGPRTEWDDLVKLYSKEIPHYICRQWSKTAWTGWAQINQGHCVNNDDVAEKLAYDLYYLKHRNVFWEIGILVKAVFLALGGRHD